jgi:DNA-binding response OmpR family regulator
MSFPKTILMIEDDAPTREVVRMAMLSQNLNLIEADTGEKGMEMIEKSEPDLVILDLNLPGVSGMDVCRQLRADGTQVPVIMLTAKNDTIDVVVGLEVGADDYLTKPFEVRELLARVGAHLRRSEQAVSQAQPKTRFEFPGLIIDMNSRQVWREGKEVALTLTEFNLRKVWGYEVEIETRTVDAHVYRLRKKIERDSEKPHYIHSVPGIGYRFVAD